MPGPGVSRPGSQLESVPSQDFARRWYDLRHPVGRVARSSGVHHQMPRRNRTLTRVLSGTADVNIRFDELRSLLAALGLQERIRGGHHIFTREHVAEILNLQPREGGKAKPYQVRQVRTIVVRYRLAEELT
jgi:hypothetical protein